MPVPELTDLLPVVAASLAVFMVAGAVQAVTGFGLALAAVPMLSLFLDTSSAVVGAVAVGAVVTGAAAWKERQYVERTVARRISIMAVVGMPAGFVAIVLFSERALTMLVCLVVLGLVVALGCRVSLPSGVAAQRTAGVASGALLTSTSMNGPPLVLVLHGAGTSPRDLRATLQAIFCGQGVVAVAGFLLLERFDSTALAIAIGGCCGFWPGWRVGDRLFQRMSADVFSRVVLIGLALTAAVSLVGAWV